MGEKGQRKKACTSKKGKIFSLLHADTIGMSLTETFGVNPSESVTGYYFARPESRYMNISAIGRDQLEVYAQKKNMSVSNIITHLGDEIIV